MDDLIDQIVATGTLRCTNCREFLKCPVMLIMGRGNVCAKCYESIREQPDLEVLENGTINTLLNTLEFPCEYEQNGCGKRLTCSHLHEHMRRCSYKTVECLLRPECKWSGTMHDLTLHFSRDHVKKVHTNQEDTFRVPFLAVTDATLLKTTVGTYMFYVRIKEDNVQFYLYDVDQIPNMKQCKVKVTCNGSDPKVSFFCKISKDIMSLIQDDPSACKTHPLKTLAGTEHLVIVFRGGDDTGLKMDASILEILECLVCKVYMRPNIYQCVKGHDICSACRLKLQACPLCQGKYEGTRNYSLEGLVAQMKYPCMYEEQGCSVRALASTQHESTCTYRPWECPVNECTFKSFYSDFLAHVERHHTAQCILEKKYVADEAWRQSLSNTGESNGTTYSHTVYFSVYRKLFELSFTGTSTKCTWKMDVIAPKEDDAKYKVTVSIENADGILGISLSCFCQYKETVTNDDHSLSISTATLMKFIREHANFKYFVTLEKARAVA